MMDELFSFSFSSSTRQLTVSSLTLVEKPKTGLLDPFDAAGLLNPFDATLNESIVSKDTDSELDCRAPR